MALKRRSKVQVEFSMSSMTDLIFLLLIFFMITASFVSPNALNLSTPTADMKVVTDPNVTVSIDRSLDYYYNGSKIALDNLPSVLQTELSSVDKPVIMIQADKTVPIDYIVKVMIMGKKLNAKTVLETSPEP